MRFGSRPEDQDVLVCQAKILGRGTAKYMYTAGQKTLPALSTERLKTLSERAKYLFYVSFPDGHPANKLVLTQIAEAVPLALVAKGIVVDRLGIQTKDNEHTTFVFV